MISFAFAEFGLKMESKTQDSPISWLSLIFFNEFRISRQDAKALRKRVLGGLLGVLATLRDSKKTCNPS